MGVARKEEGWVKKKTHEEKQKHSCGCLKPCEICTILKDRCSIRGPCREVWLQRSGYCQSIRLGAGQKMSASVGPQSGPRPPTVPVPMPDTPDLSHLTEEERKIITAVMVRQREEEDKEQVMLK